MTIFQLLGGRVGAGVRVSAVPDLPLFPPTPHNTRGWVCVESVPCYTFTYWRGEKTNLAQNLLFTLFFALSLSLILGLILPRGHS